VDDLYESFYTESGNTSKGTTEPSEMLEEIIHYSMQQINLMTEERAASNSKRKKNSIK